MSGVFQGIRVLDFGRFIAGPYCATLLGDMGAEVIRVERVGGGEDRYVAPVAESGEGGTFLQLNRNKKNIAVNPTSEAGREIVEKLIVTADVVVANLPRPTLVQMGLDYDSLKRIRPDIILATVSAFGSEGPYADRVGFDGVGQMMSGAAYLSGWPDRPVRWAVPYVDFATALGSAFGVSCALYHRQLTGEGQIVEGSLLRSALTLANSALIEQAVRGVDR
ncbi:MAG: CoA transferase, partial [Caldilineaceae bacterium]|nr:CoA transferase [Caldilineaceae bacterium]